MSVVQKIKELKTANELNFEKRLELKGNGRPLPELQLKQTSKDRNKDIYRHFRKTMYDLCEWICGCEVTNAFYCFVCLMFSNENDPLWYTTGVRDIKHLKEKIKKHSLSADHMNSSVNFATIGSVDIRSQLDNSYRKSITDFNENVSKNRYILNKIIDCVKFCGTFKLALQRNNEIQSSSENPRIFHGLLDLVSELDPIFKEYLEKTAVLKNMYKTMQNDLLDSMLAVAQEQIKLEIQSTDYVAIQVDETTDSSNRTQLVFIVRYVLSGILHERFLKLVIPPGITAERYANVILNELENLELNKTPAKLIAQSYDRASSMSGGLGGVQKKIKEHYPAANFLHCYAHELNFILQKAVSRHKDAKFFFANLYGFSSFFSRSPKCMGVLNEFVKRRLSRDAPLNWYFNTQCVQTVYLRRTEILACLKKIVETEEDSSTNSQALVLKTFLQSENFLFWLNFFHLIMPQCEIVFNKILKREIDVASVKQTLIQNVREKILHKLASTMQSSSTNSAKRQNEDSKLQSALEVCDTIISEMNHRFSCSVHLIITQLFYNDQFEEYKNNFPDDIFKLVKKNFTFINSFKLKSELETIYDRDDFHGISGVLPMLQLFIKNKLSETFSETIKLLTVLCTFPMTTTESGRCFSTLKRIETFLHTTKNGGQKELCALAMLSIEKSFINNIADFNERVINHFTKAKELGIDLKFKL